MVSISEIRKNYDKNKQSYKFDVSTLNEEEKSFNIVQQLENNTIRYPEIKDSPLYDLMKNYMDNSYRPRDIAALCTALSFASSVCGRYFEFEGQYSTLYSILFAKSASGKDSMKKSISFWSKQIGAPDLFPQAENVTSAAALQRYCVSNPQSCLCIDEIGSWFTRAKKSEIGASAIEKLRIMYTMVNDTLNPSGYADATNDAKKQPVERPAMSILGTGVYDEMREFLQSGYDGGDTGRFLLYKMTDGITVKETDGIVNLPQRCIDALKNILDVNLDWTSLTGVYNLNPNIVNGKTADKLNAPIRCYMKGDTLKMLDIYYQSIYEKNLEKDPAKAFIYSRTMEKAKRIAIIIALCGRQYKDLPDLSKVKENGLEITEQDLEMALNIVECSNKIAIDRKEELNFSDKVQRAANTIFDLVDKNEYVLRKDLKGKISGISGTTWDEVEECLELMGIQTLTEGTGKTAPKKYIKLNTPSDATKTSTVKAKTAL